MLHFAKLLPFLRQSSDSARLVSRITIPYGCVAKNRYMMRLVAMADAGDLVDMSSANIVAAEQPDVSRLFGSTGKCATQIIRAIVWPFLQESSDIAARSNLLDEIVYPVAISFVDKGIGIDRAGRYDREPCGPSASYANAGLAKVQHYLADIQKFATFIFVTNYSRFPSAYKT